MVHRMCLRHWLERGESASTVGAFGLRDRSRSTGDPMYTWLRGSSRERLGEGSSSGSTSEALEALDMFLGAKCLGSGVDSLTRSTSICKVQGFKTHKRCNTAPDRMVFRIVLSFLCFFSSD